MIFNNCAAYAQSAPQTSTPSEAPPEQSSPASPSGKMPAEQTRTRRLRNAVGIGGSIGVSGNNTGLSEGGVALMTKNDLTDLLSIRSINVFGSTRIDNTVALTVNLPIRGKSEQVLLIPFVGGGALISSKYSLADLIVRGLVTGGIDVPLARRLMATASVNIGFTNTTNIGVQVGVSYRF